MNPHLSVVIPCYNEEQNIRLGALDKVARYLEKQPYTYEVLVVDDGSTDESLSLIKKFILTNNHFRIIVNPHQGKAATVVTGVGTAQGELILFSDLDQSTPIDQTEKLLPWFDKNFDVVIGSRKHARAGAPFLRRLMGPGFMLVRNIILGLGDIQDTQCGFKMFRKNAAKTVFSRIKLYQVHRQIVGSRVTAGFDVELLFIAKRLDYKIKEVPVEWHYVDTRRVSPVMDSIDALIDIIKIRQLSLKGEYDVKHS